MLYCRPIYVVVAGVETRSGMMGSVGFRWIVYRSMTRISMSGVGSIGWLSMRIHVWTV